MVWGSPEAAAANADEARSEDEVAMRQREMDEEGRRGNRYGFYLVHRGLGGEYPCSPFGPRGPLVPLLAAAVERAMLR